MAKQAVLTNTIKEILNKYELNPKEALWDCHGTWIMYHRYIEKVAQIENITTELAQVISSDPNNVAIHVIGRAKNDVVEWSIGEASPKNCKNSYYFAMAEKRAKDRVILKLVGLAGHVYSKEDLYDKDHVDANGNPDPFNNQSNSEPVQPVNNQSNSEPVQPAKSNNKRPTAQEFAQKLIKEFHTAENLTVLETFYTKNKDNIIRLGRTDKTKRFYTQILSEYTKLKTELQNAA